MSFDDGDALTQVRVGRSIIAPQRIALVEERRDDTGGRAEPQLVSAQQHVRQPGMHPERCHRTPVSRDARLGVDGTELSEQLARLSERRGRGRVHPTQCCGIDHPCKREIERQWGEIRLKYLRAILLQKPRVFLY